jgi:N6-L-threonylcarbamoyladenine synthase
LPTPPDPHLALLVSGGHTALIRVDGPGVTTLLGATRDDAAGEAFDKVGKMLGLGYPGGVAIDRLAATGDPHAFVLPRALPRRDDLDFSFSGLKTAVLTLVKTEKDAAHADIARAFVEAIVEVLVAKCTRALETTGLDRLVVAGGVSANQQLREGLDAQAKRRRFEVYYPEPALCTDNGAMIALTAALKIEAATGSGSAFSVKPRWDLAA